MNYRVISGRELTPELVARWATIQEADPALASPYFRPEFTQAVAAIRDDVFVALLAENRREVGFFPFQRGRGGTARPVGLGLSDYHGVIAEPGTAWTAVELLRGCGLSRWEFDHLPAGQQQFAPWFVAVSESPIIETAQGMETFEASRDKAGRKQLREAQRKQQKLAEKLGPLTFSLHTADRKLLRQLMAWKSEQCRKTGTVDFFALEWCRQLIERLHADQSPNFGGLLACLHAGDTLAALHFAIYSRQVWHSWFPAYNHDLEEFSPGFVLLLEMIKAADQREISHIDLGKGISLYKRRVMTGGIPLAEGCIALPTLANRMDTWRQRAEAWGKRSCLYPLLRIPGRWLKLKERSSRYD